MILDLLSIKLLPSVFWMDWSISYCTEGWASDASTTTVKREGVDVSLRSELKIMGYTCSHGLRSSMGKLEPPTFA